MNVKYVVYYCLDAIKAISKESSVNESHVLYLLDKYRAMLLKKYALGRNPLSDSNYQTICLDLVPAQSNCDNFITLSSTHTIPTTLNVLQPTLLFENGMESERFIFVPLKRFKAVTYNKWNSKFLYCTIGTDNKLYIKSTNHQSSYLKKIRMKTVFEDYAGASELECGNTFCDIMDSEFPLEPALVPELIAYVIKDGLGIIYRPKDDINNASDDLADLMLFIKQNMKKPLQKQLEGIDE